MCFIHNANFLSVKTRLKWCTLWHGTETLPKHSFLSKYQTLPWYTCKCKVIFSHRKLTALPVPIITMLIIIQYICVEMCTKFFSPYQLKNVENVGKISFTSPIFMEHITTSGIIWRSPISSYTPTGQEIWKPQVEIHWHL